MTIFRLYKEMSIKISNWNIAVLLYSKENQLYILVSSVQSLTRVWLSDPWSPASQASLSISNCQSFLKLMSIESLMPCNHHPLSSPSLIFNFSHHQGLFQWVCSSHQVVKVSDLQLQHVLPMNIEDWFPLGWSGVILQSKELSRVFFNTTVQKHQFFGTQLSSWSNSHIHTGLLEKS